LRRFRYDEVQIEQEEEKSLISWECFGSNAKLPFLMRLQFTTVDVGGWWIGW